MRKSYSPDCSFVVQLLEPVFVLEQFMLVELYKQSFWGCFQWIIFNEKLYYVKDVLLQFYFLRRNGTIFICQTVAIINRFITDTVMYEW